MATEVSRWRDRKTPERAKWQQVIATGTIDPDEPVNLYNIQSENGVLAHPAFRGTGQHATPFFVRAASHR